VLGTCSMMVTIHGPGKGRHSITQAQEHTHEGKHEDKPARSLPLISFGI
jgi:hypothetical protein